MDLFFSFLKIGLFTLGGGFAMLPLIERELVARKGALRKEEFFEIVALAQAIPGIIAVNIAVLVGYKLRKVRGALSCAAGVIIPSFLVIVAIARYAQGIIFSKTLEGFFKGVIIAIGALIVHILIRLAQHYITSLRALIVALAAAALFYGCAIPVAALLVVCGAAGYYLIKE